MTSAKNIELEKLKNSNSESLTSKSITNARSLQPCRFNLTSTLLCLVLDPRDLGELPLKDQNLSDVSTTKFEES